MDSAQGLKLDRDHLVLVPLPAQGHLPPVIRLAAKLAAQGFVVTIVNIDSIHEILQKSWKPSPGHDVRLESVRMEIKIPEGFNSETLNQVTAFIDALWDMRDRLTELFTRLASEKGATLRCVVSDYYHIAAPYAAWKAGVAPVCFWSGMASWASIEFNIPELISQGHLPVEEANGEQVVDYLPGLEPMRVSDLPLYMYEDYYNTNFTHERSIFRTKRTKLEPWVLVNSVYEYEPRVFDAMEEFLPGRFVAIGPLFPLSDSQDCVETPGEVSLRKEDRKSLEWLDQHAPGSVLYIAFGSVSVLSFEEFEELAGGVEDSGTPFLWAIPENLILDMDEEFLSAFAERTRDQGMIVSWAPQLAVLQHGSVGGFITHCGWNSVFESASAGVPMLGWPCNSEQNTNSKLMLEDRGLGAEIRVKTREGIQQAITSLMSGETRVRARKFQELSRAAAAPGGSSHENLQEFLRSLAGLKACQGHVEWDGYPTVS